MLCEGYVLVQESLGNTILPVIHFMERENDRRDQENDRAMQRLKLAFIALPLSSYWLCNSNLFHSSFFLYRGESMGRESTHAKKQVESYPMFVCS